MHNLYRYAVVPSDLTPQRMQEFIRLNAGKAFELMMISVETDRKDVGLPPIEEVRKNYQEDFEIIQVGLAFLYLYLYFFLSCHTDTHTHTHTHTHTFSRYFAVKTRFK
jgi:hypothetical protein